MLSNNVTITLCNRSGRQITELQGRVNDVTWRLNKPGVANIMTTYSSTPKQHTRIGQLVVLQFANGLPTFGGTIEGPLRRGTEALGIKVVSGENLLSFRRTDANTAVSGTRGTIVKALVNSANSNEPTGIIPSGMTSSGESLSRTYNRQLLQDIADALADTQDYQVKTTFANRQLDLELYWYRQRGRDLTDDVLLKPANENIRSDQQGPIRNYIIAVGNGITAIASDAGSITDHGRREHVVYFGDVSNQADLQDLADAYLNKWRRGGHRITISRVSEDHASYSAYDVGDRVSLEAFMDKGDWALEIPVRILARSWSPDGLCTLEVEEWLG